MAYFRLENRLERKIRRVIRQLKGGSKLVGTAYERGRVSITADARRGNIQVCTAYNDYPLRIIHDRLLRDGYAVKRYPAIGNTGGTLNIQL